MAVLCSRASREKWWAAASCRPQRVGIEPPPSGAIGTIALVVTLITDVRAVV